jgi:hypothetical protein
MLALNLNKKTPHCVMNCYIYGITGHLVTIATIIIIIIAITIEPSGIDINGGVGVSRLDLLGPVMVEFLLIQSTVSRLLADAARVIVISHHSTPPGIII